MHMDLWNEYEGKTIAGSFPLEKLLRPQGRSAFFSTSNGTGTPAVIRVVEALNDEQEILARWRVIAEMKQVNLVAIRKCGETEVDGTPLIYAVMEPTDANLADVLNERTLTVEETRQIAISLVAALEALHGRNLVHEHIEPVNVFAAGEVVKLRSDCIRDVPDGANEAELKARDVHDLAVLLLQALAQRKQLRSDGIPLPAPFEEIVRNGVSGVWGLPQMAAALAPPAWQRPDPVRPAVQVKPVEAVRVTAPIPIREVAPAVRPAPARDIEEPVEEQPGRTKYWIAGVVVLLVALLVIGIHYLRTGQASQPNPVSETAGSAQGVSAVPPARQADNAATGKDASRQVKKPSATERESQLAKPAGRADWRVVAYTYNHVSQAQAKVKTIEKQHPELKPEVFTPSGLPPYLVTLGGAMSRDEAMALRAKARAEGFPRDLYAQNYTGKAR
jgi:hypothetical protein